jgi:hypothetical protein
MSLATLTLATFLSFTPLSKKDSTKIKFPIPKNNLTEYPISINQSKTQYNIPISKNTFLFTEYDSPKNFYKPKVETKDLPYLGAGIKIKF